MTLTEQEYQRQWNEKYYKTFVEGSRERQMATLQKAIDNIVAEWVFTPQVLKIKTIGQQVKQQLKQ